MPISKKGLVLFLFSHGTYIWNMLELPQWGDSNKYPEHMFLEVLNTMFLHNF